MYLYGVQLFHVFFFHSYIQFTRRMKRVTHTNEPLHTQPFILSAFSPREFLNKRYERNYHYDQNDIPTRTDEF